MVWHETRPGIWQDELDGAEKTFYNMSQAFRTMNMEHGSVHAVCTIKMESFSNEVAPETVLRHAWKALRFQYPALSVTVEEGSKKTYKTPTPEELEQWVHETFFADPNQSAEDTLLALHLRKLPCLFFLPKSSEVVFHSSHWRIDGIGTCMLLDRFFALATQYPGPLTLPWSQEAKNLSPSMEDAYGSPTVATPATEAFAREITHKNHVLTADSSASLPYKGDRSTLPGKPRSRSITLSRNATSDLSAACKAHGISVTAAVHAALAQATYDLFSSRQSNDTLSSSTDTSTTTTTDRYINNVTCRSCYSNSSEHPKSCTTLLAISTRSYLQPPYSTRLHACTAYLTGISPNVSLAPSVSFIDRAVALTQIYKAWYSDAYMRALRPIYAQHGEALAARARAVAREEVSPPSGATLSSLGVVEKFLKGSYVGEGGDDVAGEAGAAEGKGGGGTAQKIEVQNFKLGSVILTRQMTLYQWTFRGALTLRVCFNEAYHDTREKGVAGLLLEGVRRELGTGLVVSLERVR